MNNQKYQMQNQQESRMANYYGGTLQKAQPYLVVGRLIYGAISWGIHYRRKLISDAQYQENVERIEVNATSGRLGDSSLGKAKDALRLNMLPDSKKPEYGGLYLGYLQAPETPEPLFWHGDEHLFVCGAAGSGKSWTMVTPIIISSAMETSKHAPESCVVLDIKGDLHASTHEARAKLDGVEPIVIAPWEKQTAKVNVLFDIIDMARSGEPIKEAITRKAVMLMPLQDGSNAWVRDEARRIAIFILVYLATDEPNFCHLAFMADVAALTQQKFINFMWEMAESKAGDGYVAEQAQTTIDVYGRKTPQGDLDEHAKRQYGWVQQELDRAFGLYSKGTYLRNFVTPVLGRDENGDIVIDQGYDPAIHKQKACAAYLKYPAKYIESHGQFSSLLLEFIINRIASSKGNVRTNFILDEIGNFNKVDVFPSSLMLLRSYGIRLTAFVQDRLSLKKYEKVGGAQLFESQSIVLAWTVSDEKHAAEIETKAGYHSEFVPTVSASMGQDMNQGAISGTEQKLPNLSRYEVGLIGKGESICMIKGERVFVLDRPFYYDIPWLNGYIKDIRNDPRFQGLNH